MKATDSSCLFRSGFRALAMVAVAGTAWAQVGIRAVTYDMVQTSYPPGGAPTERRETRAMRSDGSTVVIMTSQAPDGTPYELRMVDDLSRRINSFINAGVQTVTAIPIHQNTVDQVRDAPRRSCWVPMNATRVAVGNYYALRSKITVGDREIERLTAPQLGCINLLTVIREDGKVQTVQAVENLRLGEPDPGLFTVPANYRQASPAEVSRLIHEKFGGPPYNPDGLFERLIQDAYLEQRGEKRPGAQD